MHMELMPMIVHRTYVFVTNIVELTILKSEL